MLFKEGNNLLKQIQPIAHFKPITKAVIGSVIALDVNLTTFKEIPQLIKQYPVFRSQFEAKARFNFRSTAL